MTYQYKISSAALFFDICVRHNTELFFEAEERLRKDSGNAQKTDELQKEVLRLAWNASVSMLHFFEWDMKEKSIKSNLSDYIKNTLSPQFNTFNQEKYPTNTFNGEEILFLLDIANSNKHRKISRLDKKIDDVGSIVIRENTNKPSLPIGEALLFSKSKTLQTVVIEKDLQRINNEDEIVARSLYCILKKILSFVEKDILPKISS